MEDLAQRWKKLSLSEAEGKKHDLTKDKKVSKHVIAAKFFTRRSVNVEAVARTFRPIWRTKQNFEVSMAGDNILLIAFEAEVDAEKVIQGEPWVFDRHLVVLQRYDGSVPVTDLCFDRTSFWVQIHNLPFSLRTVDAAVSLGETLGIVTKPKDEAEMKGGQFMRVRVAVDVTKLLCRGRMITWDQERDGWASFMYERLPNICYWCGLLSHDDKECEMWLRSKGGMSTDEQQFGPWLRASQFNPARKAIVEVQGFDSSETNQRLPSRTARSTSLKTVGSLTANAGKGAATVEEEAMKSASMEVTSRGGVQESDTHVHDSMTAGPQTRIPDFEAMIKEIDEAISTEPDFLNSKVHTQVPSQVKMGKDKCAGIYADFSEEEGRKSQILEKVANKVGTQIPKLQPTDNKFVMGRADTTKERKTNRSGPTGGHRKGKNNIGPPSGPTNGNVKLTGEEIKSPRRGSWTRLQKGSRYENDQEPIDMEMDPKRKYDALVSELSESTCMEKKQRLDEETRSLSILMATHLGSAEAAVQPCREQ